MDKKAVVNNIKHGFKYFYKYFLAILMLFIFSFFLVKNANCAADNYSYISYRFNDFPISSSSVKSAKRVIENMNESLYTASFWLETENVQLENDETKVSSSALYVDGIVEPVFPAEFISGYFPSVYDDDGIAVSEQIAWQLFGGTNIVGQELTISNEKYYISGVFRGKDPYAVIKYNASNIVANNTTPPEEGGVYPPENEGLNFTGITLAGDAGIGDARQKAADFLTEIGISEFNAIIINESEIAAIIRFLAIIPFVIVFTFLLIIILRLISKKMPFIIKNIFWFIVLIILAFAIPKWLGNLPSWIIPTKWSDMTHWSYVIEQLRQSANNWLNLTPYVKDVDLKWLLIKQVILMLPAAFFAFKSVAIWNRHINETEIFAKNENEQNEFENSDAVPHSDEELLQELELIRAKAKKKEEMS